jgi:hypothetical protein
MSLSIAMIAYEHFKKMASTFQNDCRMSLIGNDSVIIRGFTDRRCFQGKIFQMKKKLMRRTGIEPVTLGLKGPCSAN